METSGVAAATTVLIADADPLVAGGLALLVGADPGLELIGTYCCGSEAVFEAQSRAPDVVVMDIRLLDLDGFTTLRLLHGIGGGPGPRVVVTSGSEHGSTVVAAVLAGVAGYVLKQTAPADLVRAIRHVADGHAWLDPYAVSAVIDALARTPRAGQGAQSGGPEQLTPRELEVLLLMADGLSNAEISERLVVSEGTVKTHVSRVLMKLAARDRAQAIALAYRSGWISLVS